MATYIKPANPFSFRDFLAARWHKVEADGSFMPWGQHVWWWLDGGWKRMWFYLDGRMRVGYVRVNKKNEVSVAMTVELRRTGGALALLLEMRKHVPGTLYARIHRLNVASRMLFVKAGYLYQLHKFGESDEWVFLVHKENK